MKLNIRQAKIFDVYPIYKLERQCFTNPWSFDSLFSDICLNGITTYVVAELDGEIIGYGGLWLILDEAHVTNIAISSAHRSRGFGKMLLRVLLNAAERAGALEMSLEVRQSNERAIRMYENEGFEIIGVRNKYYTNPVENAYIMRKNLSTGNEI